MGQFPRKSLDRSLGGCQQRESPTLPGGACSRRHMRRGERRQLSVFRSSATELARETPMAPRSRRNRLPSEKTAPVEYTVGSTRGAFVGEWTDLAPPALPGPMLACCLDCRECWNIARGPESHQMPCRSYPESSPGKRLRHLVMNLGLRRREQPNPNLAQRPLAEPGLSIAATLTLRRRHPPPMSSIERKACAAQTMRAKPSVRRPSEISAIVVGQRRPVRR